MIDLTFLSIVAQLSYSHEKLCLFVFDLFLICQIFVKVYSFSVSFLVICSHFVFSVHTPYMTLSGETRQ